MAVTMKDVAGAAGVSTATVSRALAGDTGVSGAKRAAVAMASARLGYRPDPFAAALRTGLSGAVGIVVPSIANPFFPAVVRAVQHELADSAIDLLFCDADDDVRTERLRITALLRRRVDALLVCPVDVQESAPTLREAMASVRLIQIDRRAVDEADFVGVNQAAGMAQVTSHLRHIGATSAAFVGSWREMSTVAAREDGFLRSCRTNGITALPSVRMFPDLASGRAFGREQARRPTTPVALVCANDEVALGILAETGTDRIGDLVITGFDDLPSAELLNLTSVRQPLAELGQEATRCLTTRSTTPRHTYLMPDIVVRRTRVPPPIPGGQPG